MITNRQTLTNSLRGLDDISTTKMPHFESLSCTSQGLGQREHAQQSFVHKQTTA